jgi:hypothetical protein
VRPGDDPRNPLPADPPAAQVWDEMVLGPGRRPNPSQAVEVRDDGLRQVRAHLHLADASLGLRIRDVETRASGVVEAHLPDPKIAKLACPNPAPPQDLADDATADVTGTDVGTEVSQVMSDRRLRDPELGRDLARAKALQHKTSHHRGRRSDVCWRIRRELQILLGCRIKHGCQLVHLQERSLRLRSSNSNPSRSRGVVVDMPVFDGLVED